MTDSHPTLWPVDTPANPSHSPGADKANTTPATSGPTCSTPFAYYDPASHSWRTFQVTFLWASDEYSEIWPRAGTTQNGTAYPRPRSAPHISVTGSSLWPTPLARDARPADLGDFKRNDPPLRIAVFWPTPTARLGTPRGAQANRYSDPKRSNDLDDAVAAWGSSGPLSPTFVEWLMGVPHRVDRLRGLGNAVVPQVAEYIGRLIAERFDREVAA